MSQWLMKQEENNDVAGSNLSSDITLRGCLVAGLRVMHVLIMQVLVMSESIYYIMQVLVMLRIIVHVLVMDPCSILHIIMHIRS